MGLLTLSQTDCANCISYCAVFLNPFLPYFLSCRLVLLGAGQVGCVYHALLGTLTVGPRSLHYLMSDRLRHVMSNLDRKMTYFGVLLTD